MTVIGPIWAKAVPKESAMAATIRIADPIISLDILPNSLSS